MRTNKGSIRKYVEVIETYNGKSISLSKTLREANLQHNIKGWIETGVAIPATGHGMYKVMSNDPRKDAIRILRMNNKLRRMQAEKKIRPLISDANTNTDKPNTDKPQTSKKKISILWGMIKIEQ
ncbi:MAG: hypothetical protein ACK5XN_27060 [Bacteroidota bacterium]